jgi:DNA invertase Pin-like site-specific DNA recombinase
MNDDDYTVPVNRRLRSKKIKTALLEPPEVLSSRLILLDPKIVPGINSPPIVVIYARFSAPSQGTGYSIEGQVLRCTRYAEEQGWKITRIFQDKGFTGANSNRPGFRALKKFLRENPGVIVLIATASRMARETDVYSEYKADTKGLHVRLIVVTLGDVGEDAIAASMVDAAKNRHELIENMRNGKEVAILDGRWQGDVPYGYYLGEDGRVYPYKRTASIVQRIYNEYAAGAFMGTIAHGLALDRIKTPRAEKIPGHKGKWTPEKVREILLRPAYRGILEQSLAVFEWERRGTKSGVAGKEIRIQAHWMRIVPDDIIQLCDARRKKYPPKSVTGQAPAHPYLLNGKVPCPTCGNSLSISNRRGHITMRCKHRSTDVECPEVRYEYPVPEALAWQVLGSALASDAESAFSDELKKGIREIYEKERATREEAAQDIRTLKAGLEQAKKDAKQGGSPFLQLYLTSLDDDVMRLVKLEKDYDALPPLPDFAAFYEARRIPMADAVQQLRQHQPFRPTDAEGLALLKIARLPLEKVIMTEDEDGLFDLTFLLNGLPWREEVADGKPSSLNTALNEFRATRTFSGLQMQDSLARKDLARRRFNQAVKENEGYPDPSFLSRLGELPEAHKRLGNGLGRAIHAVVLAVKYGFSQRQALVQLGLSRDQQKRAKVYLRCKEGQALRKKLGELLGTEVGPDNYGREGHVRTLRERAIYRKNPVLRYAVTDPSSGETQLSDDDWSALVASGIARGDRMFVDNGRKDCRLLLNSLLYVFRENAWLEVLPQGMVSKPYLSSFIKYLDEDQRFGKIILALLQARGVEPLPSLDDFPQLRDRAARFFNPKDPKPAAPIIYDMRKGKRPGRRPPLDVRKAANDDWHKARRINNAS